jgi:hypothetical protein
VFNSLKADCSRLYLLATPPVAEQIPHLTALLAACSTLAPTSCTLRSPSTAAPSSRLQYLAPCDDDKYYNMNSLTKILSEVALESIRLTR